MYSAYNRLRHTFLFSSSMAALTLAAFAYTADMYNNMSTIYSIYKYVDNH